jgi:hypothetical protein
MPLRVWYSSTEKDSPWLGTNPLPVLAFSVPASQPYHAWHGQERYGGAPSRKRLYPGPAGAT